MDTSVEQVVLDSTVFYPEILYGNDDNAAYLFPHDALDYAAQVSPKKPPLHSNVQISLPAPS